MTMQRYGRATPLQMDMLGLGGEICGWFSPQPPGDEERMREMKSSRERLRKIVGVDFGYDLEAWHHYFLKCEQHTEEYTFSYAWRAVQAKILELIKDPDRLRLVRLTELHESK